jgi:hypothetical protein
MEQFKAHRFLEFAAQLEGFPYVIAGQSDEKQPLRRSDREAIRQWCDRWEPQIAALGFRATLGSFEEARQLSSAKGASWGGFDPIVRELKKLLIREAKYTLFFYLDASEAALFVQSRHYGEDVAQAFESTLEDIDEAANCLAFERGTACVFHLTRVLQVGLYALASDLGVKPANRNWGLVIKDLDEEIKTRRTAGPGQSASDEQKQRWRDDNEFYASAAMHFDHLLQAYRNNAIHKAGKMYPPHKARSLFDHTRDFMKHLATRLKESP